MTKSGGSDDFFIEESAFEGCKNLRSITINSDPIYAFIRKYAFRNTGITILHLPSFVSSNWHFEDDVFEGSDLTKVWVESIYQYPNIGNNTFGDKIKDITCPYLQSARLKENWSGYADYIREDYQLLDEDRGFLASNGMTEGPYCPHQLVLRRKNLTPGQYFLTSSTCHPKFVGKERCNALMTFHEHCFADCLLVLRKVYLYCYDCLCERQHFVDAHPDL